MLVKWQPFGSLLSNQDVFGDLLDTKLQARARAFAPRIEVRENDKSYFIDAELPPAGIAQVPGLWNMLLRGNDQVQRHQGVGIHPDVERPVIQFNRITELDTAVLPLDIGAAQ